jgi:hypothetical protein
MIGDSYDVFAAAALQALIQVVGKDGHVSVPDGRLTYQSTPEEFALAAHRFAMAMVNRRATASQTPLQPFQPPSGR